MKLRNVLFAIVIVILLSTLSGCGKAATPAPESVAPALTGPVGAVKDPVAAWNVAQAYYSKGYKLQNDFMSKHQYAMGLDSKFRLGLLELIANQSSCFANVSQTESTIADAVMSDQNLTEAAINALVTSSVSGEMATTECASLSRTVADYVISNRAAMFDARQAAYDVGLSFKAFLHDQIGNYIINDLISAATNNQDIKDWMLKNNIGITDFTWFPTNDLQYVIGGSTAQTTCEYFRNGKAIEELDSEFVAKFAGHEGDLKSLYRASWNSNEGKCTLYRWAAFDKLLVVPTSSTTQNVFGTGEDESAFPTPTK